MLQLHPWKTGIALALTVAIGYTVCTVIYGFAPEEGMNFLNALFHGLDFRKLGALTAFTFSMFFYPLIVFLVWGFAVGALYGWLHNLLHGGDR